MNVRASRLTVIAAVVAVVASAVLLFKDLGLEGIATDEAARTIVAVEMLRDGHWFFPTFRGEPEARKPPLSMWLAAVTLRLAGESEAALRFWPAVFALGTVIIVFWLAARAGGALGGFTAAMLMITVPEFLFDHCARTNVPDSALVFFTAASLAVYVHGPAGVRGAFLAGVLGGSALLSKGVAALALFAVVGMYELLATRGRGWLRARPWIFGLTALAVAALWFVPAWWMMRQAVSDEIAKDLGDRIGGAGLFHRGGFYFLELVEDFGPWLLLVPPALVTLARRKEPAAWLLPVWAAVVLALFTVAGSKYRWYVLPAYPAVTAVLGIGASAATARFRRAPASQAVWLVVVAVLLVPGWLRAYRRTGEIRWEHSNLRAFGRFVSATLPADVPVFLYREPLNHAFAGHETLYAFWLRDRLRPVATAEELCAGLDAAPKGAFAIVPESDLATVPCLAGFEQSLVLGRLRHASRDYVPKRIVPWRIATPPFFAPAEVSVNAASGTGFLAGWAEALDGPVPTLRRLTSRHAFVSFDLQTPVDGMLGIEGEWNATSPQCAARLVLNGRPLGALAPAGSSFATALEKGALLPGQNLLEIDQSCPETEVAVAKVLFREKTRSVNGAAGVLRDFPPVPGLVGRRIRDPAASRSEAVVAGGGTEGHPGYLFFAPVILPPGRYTASFELRALNPVSLDPAAVIDVYAMKKRRTFARRALTAAEMYAERGYLSIPLEFTLYTTEKVQPRVEVSGAAEVRFGGVTVRSEGGHPRPGAATRR